MKCVRVYLFTLLDGFIVDIEYLPGFSYKARFELDYVKPPVPDLTNNVFGLHFYFYKNLVFGIGINEVKSVVFLQCPDNGDEVLQGLNIPLCAVSYTHLTLPTSDLV